MTSINISLGVSVIGDSVFYGCSSLTHIEIPKSVYEIGSDAFYGCENLRTVYVSASTPPDLYGGAFSDCPADIYVPMESVEAYKNAEGWSEYASRIVGY